MTPDPQIGSFRLIEPLGEGGMGRVYRAEHDRTGVEVAVKVLAGETDPAASERFHREVQAHAGLVHPGIVYLFDYGSVDEPDELLAGEVPEGSPFVAMELAERGTVRELMPVFDWATARWILMQTLDALAFSHARGVIHRDLKPENLLLCDDGGHPRMKLADFGIAHALEDASSTAEEELRAFAGTPAYMAPEQLRSHWRRFGPWTDLYAVGCIGWELICGRIPFEANTPVEMAIRHTESKRPPLEPQFPVPDGVEAWIQKTMAVEPDRRFQFAADAARRLPEADEELHTGAASNDVDCEVQDETSGPLEPTRLPEFATTVIVDLPGEEIGDGIDDAISPDEPLDATPAIPDRWELPELEPVPAPLVGTGVELFGLRDVPLVDRDRARRILWEQLHGVAETSRPHLAVLGAEAGVGKTRLARALATKAHEVGAARVLRTVHTRSGRGATEGLSGIVHRAFQTWKLTRRECYEELLERLPALDDEDGRRRTDAAALTEVLRPAEGDLAEAEGPAFRFSSPAQKYALFERLFRRIAEERALIVWFDDLQWGGEAMGLVEHLMKHRETPLPLLIVATVRSDIRAERDELDRQLAALESRDDVRHIDLQPLDAGDQRRLLDHMLPLSGELARRLADKTEGNPLFVQQLLGDWIATDRLEVGEEGFVLEASQDPTIPDDIHQLWMTRLDRLVDGRPPRRANEILETIELAACLGREVDDEEWKKVCRRANLRIPPRLVGELIDRGLAERTDGGWSFTHGLLVDSIRRSAVEGGRWERQNRRCARMLEADPGRKQRDAARLADHWIAAGEPERALQPLVVQCRWENRNGRPERSLAALKRRGEMLDRLEVGEFEPRRMENELLGAGIRYNSEGVEGVSSDVSDLRDRADRCRDIGEWRLAARFHGLLGEIYRARGRMPEAKVHYEEVVEFGRRADALLEQGKGWLELGFFATRQGEFSEAERCRRRASAFVQKTGAYYDRGRCKHLEARIAMFRGEVEKAHEILREVADEARRRALRPLEADVIDDLSRIARYFDNISRAMALGRRYRKLAEETDSVLHRRVACQILAQVEAADRQFDRVARLLEELQRIVDRASADMPDELIHCIYLVLYAGTRKWDDFDRRFQRYDDGWPLDYGLEWDYPLDLELAAAFAEEAGKTDRARRLLQLARSLWRRMGADERVERINARLSALGAEATDNTHTS